MDRFDSEHPAEARLWQLSYLAELADAITRRHETVKGRQSARFSDRKNQSDDEATEHDRKLQSTRVTVYPYDQSANTLSEIFTRAGIGYTIVQRKAPSSTGAIPFRTKKLEAKYALFEVTLRQAGIDEKINQATFMAMGWHAAVAFNVLHEDATPADRKTFLDELASRLG